MMVKDKLEERIIEIIETQTINRHPRLPKPQPKLIPVKIQNIMGMEVWDQLMFIPKLQQKEEMAMPIHKLMQTPMVMKQKSNSKPLQKEKTVMLKLRDLHHQSPVLIPTVTKIIIILLDQTMKLQLMLKHQLIPMEETVLLIHKLQPILTVIR